MKSEDHQEMTTLASISAKTVQWCGSEIIFSGSGSYLDLNFGSGFGFESGSDLFMINSLEIQIM